MVLKNLIIKSILISGKRNNIPKKKVRFNLPPHQPAKPKVRKYNHQQSSNKKVRTNILQNPPPLLRCILKHGNNHDKDRKKGKKSVQLSINTDKHNDRNTPKPSEANDQKNHLTKKPNQKNKTRRRNKMRHKTKPLKLLYTNPN